MDQPPEYNHPIGPDYGRVIGPLILYVVLLSMICWTFPNW